MNNSKSYRDILDEYAKSTGIEKAPGNFTHNVMQHIYLEKNPYKAVTKKNYVPVITVVVTGLLISASLLFPVKTPEIIDRLLPAINVNLKFPDINNLIVLPKIVLPVVAAVVILTCLDALLKSLFHRRNME